MQVLNQLVIPQLENECQQLYYKGKKISLQAEGVQILKGGTLSFNTYFNLFEHTIFQTKTGIQSVDFTFALEGAATATIYHCGADQAWYTKVWLQNTNASIKGKVKKNKVAAFEKLEAGRETITIPVLLKDLPQDGFLYLEIKAKTDSIFYGGSITTTESAKNNVKLAILLPVDQNAAKVKANAAQIESYLKANQLQDAVAIKIIANEENASEFADGTVLSKKSLGASGSYARGMLLALQEQFTHFLFLKENSVLELESLSRTYAILKNLHAADSSIIGGSILQADNKNLQLSKEAYLTEDLLSIVHVRPEHLDLQKEENLVLNGLTFKTSTEFADSMQYAENRQFVDMAYACYPTLCLQRHGFPLPMHLQGAEIEFGLRQKECDFIYANGIGVWQTMDADRHPLAECYDNEKNLVRLQLLNRTNRLLNLTDNIDCKFNDTTANYNFDAWECLATAYADILKEIDFAAEDRPLKEIQAKYTVKSYTKAQLLELGYDINTLSTNQTPNAKLLTVKDFELHESLPNILYNAATDTGYILYAKDFPKSRYQAVEARYKQLKAEYIASYPHLQKAYKDIYPKLISATAWEKLLDLPQQDKAHFNREQFVNVAYFINSVQACKHIFKLLPELYNARIRPVFLTQEQDIFELLQVKHCTVALLSKNTMHMTIQAAEILLQNAVDIVHDFTARGAWLKEVATLGARAYIATDLKDTINLLAEYDRLKAELPNLKKITALVLVQDHKIEKEQILQMLKAQNFTNFSTVVVEKAVAYMQKAAKQQSTELEKDIAHFTIPAISTQATLFRYALHLAHLSGTEWVYVVNEHAVLQPDSLQKLVNATAGNESNMGFVSSNIVIDVLQNKFNLKSAEWRENQVQKLEENSVDFITANGRVGEGLQEVHTFRMQKFGEQELAATSFSSVLINGRAIQTQGLPTALFQEGLADREYTLRLSQDFGSGAVVEDAVVTLVEIPRLNEDKLANVYASHLFILKNYAGDANKGNELFLLERDKFLNACKGKGKTKKNKKVTIKKALQKCKAYLNDARFASRRKIDVVESTNKKR